VGAVIDVRDESGVCTITIDRPQVKHALTGADFATLDRELQRAAADAAVGAVILTGAAGGAFCAGQDLNELADLDPLALGSHPFHAFIETLAGYAKPLIAAVGGVAVGAGVTMLPHFDFVVAAADARFRTPFVQLGVAAEGASSLLLAATVGPRLAARMLLLGEWISAPEALEAGLVTTVTGADDVLPQATAIGRRLADLPRAAVAATKRLLVEARRDAVSAALARERAAGLELYKKSAFRAALDGRGPRPASVAATGS
jgi:enoyl-CoA hydratase/carnithine racemase